MSEVLVILGSSRSEGYTRKAVAHVLLDVDYKLIDLRMLNIAPFDYDHQYVSDDHVQVIEKMIHSSSIVFATPVYWYAMSSQMKVFFDRFSDLLTIHQDLKGKLRGKRCFLLATGVDADLPEGFEVPFHRTCDYLDMVYCRSFYLAKGVTAAKEDVENFLANLLRVPLERTP